MGALMYAALVLLMLTLVVNVLGELILPRDVTERAGSKRATKREAPV
jgi:hypothetical protein